MLDALKALQRAGLLGGVEQVLDALWLARALPQGPRDIAVPTTGASTPANSDRGSATSTAPGAPATGEQLPATLIERQRPGGNDDDARPPGPDALHAPGSPGDADRPARAVGIAGVPALPDAHTLSLALKPLARRRASVREWQFDEAATVDHFAATRRLEPRFQARRERWFDALVLVESGAAEPLWRSTVNELEQLLRRRVGLRSCRRFALDTTGEAVGVRIADATAAPRSPMQLIAGDAPLVLIVSDGTSRAWEDGRMARVLASVGERAAVAVVQLLPERLWPNTALGRADARVSGGRAGQTLGRLDVAWPRWLVDADLEESASALAPLAVPVVALHPAALQGWARMLMAAPGASAAASLVFPADPQASTDEPRAPARREPLSAEQVFQSARTLVPPDVLRTAAYLAAAAPLNLAVVRLVQRAMQPGGAAGDLALLLLSGLLTRVDTPARGDVTGDDAVMFDMSSDLRELLLRSLLHDEAKRIRREISSYIAEREGLPQDMVALIESASGELTLPSWATPFAEICRQVDRVFEPAGRPAQAVRERIEETTRARGVSVRVTLKHFVGVRALSYAPDGTRFALRDDTGVVIYELPVVDGHASHPQRVPTMLRRSPQLMIVKDDGMDDALMEAALAGVRLLLHALFDRPWSLRYHTVPRRATSLPGAERKWLGALVHDAESMLCVIGTSEFMQGGWMADLRRTVIDSELTLQQVGLGSEGAAEPTWSLGPKRFQAGAWAATPLAAGTALGRRIAESLALRHPDAFVLGPDTSGLNWWMPLRPPGTGHVLVTTKDGDFESGSADNWATELSAFLGERSRAASVHDSGGWIAVSSETTVRILAMSRTAASSIARFEAVNVHTMAWARERPLLAMLSHGRLTVFDVESQSQAHWPRPIHGDLLHWSGDGNWLALRSAGPDRLTLLQPTGSTFRERFRTFDADVLAFAWSHDGRYLACATADDLVQVLDADDINAAPLVAWTVAQSADDPPPTLAFAPGPLDQDYLELAFARGARIELLRLDPRQWSRVEPVPTPTPAVALTPSLRVALQVLQALALQMHVGRLGPEEASSREDVIRICAGDAEDGIEKMRHWLTMSEYVFWGPVRELLLTGVDPINAGSRASWREAGETLLVKLQAALADEDATLYDSDAMLLEVAADAWAHRDPEGFQRSTSLSAESYEALARLRAPMRRAAAAAQAGAAGAEEPLPARAWVSSLVGLGPQSEAAERIGCHAGPFHRTFMYSGPSSLSRSDDYLAYISQLIEFWRGASERLFAADRRSGLDAAVEMRFPMAVGLLDELAHDDRFAGRIQHGDIDDRGEVRGWSLSRRTYLDLIDQLGAQVVDAVARRLRAPAYRPVVLWLGGPDELRAVQFRLDRVDLQIEQPNSPDEAIEWIEEAYAPNSAGDARRPAINLVVVAGAADPGATAVVAEATRIGDVAAGIAAEQRRAQPIVAVMASRPRVFESMLDPDGPIRTATDGDDVLYLVLESVMAPLG